ncbi:hypothetical protein BKD03_14495 [Brucella sp. 09RB8471]|nr:hypothetical protein BKD03_14495 [Brucella sp. 09RB8471]
MQLRLWAAIVIFAGSYFPLSLILLAQDFEYKYLTHDFCVEVFNAPTQCALPFYNPKISLSIFIFCALSLLVTLLIFRLAKSKRKITIIKTKYVPTELMNYTLPYIVSFMGVGYSERSKFVGMVVFLIWLFWITYKSGQLIMNPILIVLNWRLYDVTFKHDGESSEHDCLVLADGELNAGDKVRFGNIQEVMVVRKERPKRGNL